MAGSGIGSAFPVIGTLVGAIVGGLVGFFINLLSNFLGKEKRIREVQWKTHEKIDEAWSEARKSLREERATLLAPVRKQIDEAILARLQRLEENLKQPLKIISQQLALMKTTKNQLEKMPYGTIQAI